MNLIGLTVAALLAAGSAAAGPARPPITAVSHIAVYAADMAKTEAFYVHDMGAVKRSDPEDPAGVRYYFADTQFVEVLPLPQGWTSVSRLDHVALVTPDVAAMREYLLARNAGAPGPIQKGSDGSQWFRASDPEGVKVEFVQPPAHPEPVPHNPLSAHMIHFGFIAHDRAREDAFYKDVLGFHQYWAGGMRDDQPTWISMQAPDGTDWLEYMIAGTPAERGVPATMTQATAGVLNHFALGVPNAEAAYTFLWNGDRLKGQENLPKIGRDAKWQLNLIDPDGTRVELMELHAIGKPCCAPLTGKDPTY